MKRELIILLLLMFILSACGTARDKEAKITYTEEFPHVPKHPSMVFEEFTEAESEEQLSQATYRIEDEEYESFLTEYEEILIDDGWEIIQDEKPMSLSMKKGEEISVFIVYKVGDTLMLTAFAK